MATTTITLEQAGEYYSRLGQKWHAASVRGLQKAAARAVSKIKTEIIPSRAPEPVDRGVYKAGWNHEPLSDGATYGNSEMHASFIEYGVRPENVKPGRAMINALAEWAIRKGMADDEEDAQSIAWAIAKTMQRRGIFNRYAQGSGLHIMGEMNERHIQTIIVEEVVREVERV